MWKVFPYVQLIVQFQIPNERDKQLMQKYKVLGIEPGKGYSKNIFSEKQWNAIEAGAAAARGEIEASTRESNGIDGWATSPVNSGRWGDDYMTRATVAWQYIYVNTLEEAVYYTGYYDAQNERLDASANDYTLTFPAGAIPHAEFFWSVTMYNKSGFLVDNAIDRYCLSSRSGLATEPDGSTVMHIQKNNPGGIAESNWIPAPNDQFYLVFRIYGPDQNAISGNYRLPGIEKN